MGSWRAIAFASVERSNLVASLQTEQLPWDQALHVTATQSLLDAFLEEGDRAISVANFIDLVSLQGLGSHFGLPIENFPNFPDTNSPEDRAAYRNQRSKWAASAKSTKTKHAWVIDQFLIRNLASEEPNENRKILSLSRNSLRKTLSNLENSGLTPNDIMAESALSEEALKIWRKLTQAREYRYLSYQRTDYWDFDHNKTLQGRIESVLKKLISNPQSKLTIYLHGFYFYTGIQWALFRALKAMPSVNLIFIAHDDGKSKSFESWRRFFTSSLGLPELEYLESHERDSNSTVEVFENALEGRFVDERLGSIKVQKFETPTHLVRHLRFLSSFRDANKKKPLAIYGAREKDLQRFTQRLSGSLVNSSVALYQLPVGMFLVALHSCVKLDDNHQLELSMSFDDFMSMVPYILQSEPHTTVDAKKIADTRSFFSDCESLGEWEKRSALLEKNAATLAKLGKDATGFIALRMLPWSDFTEKQASEIRSIIQRISDLVSEIGLLQTVGLDEYSKFLNRHLSNALKSSNPELHEEVISRMEMFNLGDDFQVEVSGLIEIVQKLLGRESAYDEDDDDQRNDLFVKPVQALDALAFQKSSDDIFLTNLSDRTFPSRKHMQIWPFTAQEIRPSDAKRSIGPTLLKANSDFAQLGDLYLLRSAFTGLKDSKEITISWIEESMGEKHSPSPAVAMLLKLDVKSKAISDATGGYNVESPSSFEMDHLVHGPIEIEPENEVQINLSGLPIIQTSSAVYCERRFALQWAMSRSPHFQATHLHNMLYGNMIGYLVKAFSISPKSAEVICDDFWPHLPKSIKESSKLKCVIKSDGTGADPRWIYNLGGSRFGRSLNRQYVDGRKNTSYKALVEGLLPISEISANSMNLSVMPVGLPESLKDAHVLCNTCAVSQLCSSRQANNNWQES